MMSSSGDNKENMEFKTPVRSAVRPKPDMCKASGQCTPSLLLASPSERSEPKALTIPSSPFLSRLGYGTGVSVFLMNRPQTPSGAHKSPWAVKKVSKTINKDKAEAKEFEQRLNSEAELLKTLNHENIVGYRDTVRNADGSLCLCMESGEKSLADLIEARKDERLGPFPIHNIHTVVSCVSKALAYLHNDKKLLHGDIKSHNILVKGDFAEIKLCDFGVCLRLKEDLQGLSDQEECYVGTGAWSSREALEGDMITDRADIYSLGCVIYEMLTLSVPHLPSSLCDEEGDSFMEESFDEETFLEAQGSTPVLPDHICYNKSYYPYMALMTICCREEAELRPAAQEIFTTLQLLTS